VNVTSQHGPFDNFPERRVFTQGGIEVAVEAHVSFHYLAYELSYGDVVSALRGIATKMRREGVWAWEVGVFSTEDGERLGSVYVSRGSM